MSEVASPARGFNPDAPAFVPGAHLVQPSQGPCPAPQSNKPNGGSSRGKGRGRGRGKGKKGQQGRQGQKRRDGQQRSRVSSSLQGNDGSEPAQLADAGVSGTNDTGTYEASGGGGRGRRAGNANHLLNFRQQPPQRNQGRRHHQHSFESKPKSYKPRRRDKDWFIKAHCRFVVQRGKQGWKEEGEVDADVSVDWGSIEEVCWAVQTGMEMRCPICLDEVMMAPRTTRCGHVFCFPCVLRYFNCCDAAVADCPICHEVVDQDSLALTSLEKVVPVTVGDHIELVLMKRRRASIFPVQRDHTFPPINRPPQPSRDKRFHKLIMGDFDRGRERYMAEQQELRRAHMEESDPETRMFLKQAKDAATARQHLWLISGNYPMQEFLQAQEQEQEQERLIRLREEEKERGPALGREGDASGSTPSAPTLDWSRLVHQRHPVDKENVVVPIQQQHQQQQKSSQHQQHQRSGDEQKHLFPTLRESMQGGRNQPPSEPSTEADRVEPPLDEVPSDSVSATRAGTSLGVWGRPGERSGGSRCQEETGSNEAVTAHSKDAEEAGGAGDDDSVAKAQDGNHGPGAVLSEPGSAVARLDGAEALSERPCKEGNDSQAKHGNDKAVDIGDDIVYFYQLHDGQLLFMHSINWRCLKADFSEACHFPASVEGKVLEVETFEINHDVRKRHKFLEHVPLHTHVTVVELDLSDLLSSETKSIFEGELKERHDRRKRLKEKLRRQSRREEANSKRSPQPQSINYKSFPSLNSPSALVSTPVFSAEDPPLPSSPATLVASPSAACLLNSSGDAPGATPLEVDSLVLTGANVDERAESRNRGEEGSSVWSFRDVARAAPDGYVSVQGNAPAHLRQKKKNRKGQVMLFDNLGFR